jgi:hypothetical protein
MRRTRLLTACLLSVGAAGTLALFAQQNTPNERKEPLFRRDGGSGKKGEDANTRAVGGVVRTESDDPVDGAVVQLKDTKSLRVRSYITKSDGQYRFYGLSPNVDYELRAKFKDQESDMKTLSVFDNRKQAIMNLSLKKK